MCWILHLNLVIDRFKCYSACVLSLSDYFDFCCFRPMTHQSILHLVVNWEVFTINFIHVAVACHLNPSVDVLIISAAYAVII